MKVKQLILLATFVIASGPSYGQAAKEPHVRIAEIEIDPAKLEVYLDALKEQIGAALRNEAGVVALSPSLRFTGTRRHISSMSKQLISKSTKQLLRTL